MWGLLDCAKVQIEDWVMLSTLSLTFQLDKRMIYSAQCLQEEFQQQSLCQTKCQAFRCCNVLVIEYSLISKHVRHLPQTKLDPLHGEHLQLH